MVVVGKHTLRDKGECGRKMSVFRVIRVRACDKVFEEE